MLYLFGHIVLFRLYSFPRGVGPLYCNTKVVTTTVLCMHVEIQSERCYERHAATVALGAPLQAYFTPEDLPKHRTRKIVFVGVNLQVSVT